MVTASGLLIILADFDAGTAARSGQIHGGSHASFLFWIGLTLHMAREGVND